MAYLMRTSNPALNERAFKSQVAIGEAMTLQGTVNKTGLLPPPHPARRAHQRAVLRAHAAPPHSSRKRH